MGPAAARPSSRTWLVRAEDWLLAGWVGLAAPALSRVQGGPSGSPFDGGRPIDGVFGLIGVLGAIACLALPTAPAAGKPGLPGSAVVGPFVGGLLLVTLSAVSGLGLSSGVVAGLAVAIALGAVAVRLRVPPASSMVRRALVTPYVLVTGSVFWQLVNAVSSDGGLASQLRSASPTQLGAAAPVLGFLVAFSAIYYAMLVYAPRQVAEREGGLVAWLVRYALFAAGVAIGASWLAALAG